MRIIGGKLGGRRIKTIHAPHMRPTTDRVREAVFSSLGASIDFADFIALDLYAGTGAMGMEAISRGVTSCLFVELDRKLCQVLKGNLSALGIAEEARVIEGGLPEALESVLVSLATSDKRRLILADPPYTDHPEEGLFQALLDTRVINAGTVLICGRPKRIEYSFPQVDFSMFDLAEPEYRAKKYGDIVIDYYLF